jgi:hypothetical protein
MGETHAGTTQRSGPRTGEAAVDAPKPKANRGSLKMSDEVSRQARELREQYPDGVPDDFIADADRRGGTKVISEAEQKQCDHIAAWAAIHSAGVPNYAQTFPALVREVERVIASTRQQAFGQCLLILEDAEVFETGSMTVNRQDDGRATLAAVIAEIRAAKEFTVTR